MNKIYISRRIKLQVKPRVYKEIQMMIKKFYCPISLTYPEISSNFYIKYIVKKLVCLESIRSKKILFYFQNKYM